MTVIAVILVIIVCSLHMSTSFRRVVYYNRLSLVSSEAVATSRKMSLQLNRLKFINTLFNNFKSKLLEMKNVSKSVFLANTTITEDRRDEIFTRGDAGYADDDLFEFPNRDNSLTEREMYRDVNDYDDFKDDYESSYEELFLDQYAMYNSNDIIDGEKNKNNANPFSKSLTTSDNDSRELLKRSMLNFYFFREELGNVETKLDLVISNMQRVKHDVGHQIITQGESGSTLFIVEEGLLEVTINGQYIRSMARGSMIGELALLYDAPRSATVTCATKCTLWTLQRAVFIKLQSASVY